MGKLIPVLLPESLALAIGDKLPVLSFVPIILDISFLNSDEGVQFGFWSGFQLIRGQDIRFSLCYHCCLVEVTGLVFCS